MEEKKQLELLYRRYLSNECTAEELDQFLELLHDNEEEGRALMSATWNNTEAVPDSGLVPSFIPFPSRKITLGLFIKAVAAVLLLAGGLYFFRTGLLNLISPVRQMEVKNAAAEHKQVQLEDGTRVWLSANSNLSYPEHFRAGNRKVQLEGEAFFEVAHDAEHPFIVSAGPVQTTVLGTSFNIEAYGAKNKTRITLLSGKVSVSLQADKNNQQAIILPNQQVVIDKQAEKLHKVDFPQAGVFLQRRLGFYVYKGTALAEVIHDIETQYDVKIELGHGLENEIFYGNLDMTAAINQSLDKLVTVGGAKWKRNGNQYVVFRSGND